MNNNSGRKKEYGPLLQVRLPEHLYKAIKEYQDKKNYTTMSEAARSLLAHGINFEFFFEEED